MPKYKVMEEIEHQGIRYFPNDVVELTDQQAEFHGLAQSLVKEDKQHDNIKLAFTREENSDNRQS